jgi:hypothetical protein
MKSQDLDVSKKCVCRSLVVLGILSIFVVDGCVMAPKLTAADRKKDIQFMADWARDYSPFVELAQKHKGIPDYEALLPKYLQYAKQAESNEEFYQVVSEYNRLIRPIGHSYLLDEDYLRLVRT